MKVVTEIMAKLYTARFTLSLYVIYINFRLQLWHLLSRLQ